MSGQNGVSWVQISYARCLASLGAGSQVDRNPYLLGDSDRAIRLQNQEARQPWVRGLTSLDQRKFYCEEELRINRRLAAEILSGLEEIRVLWNLLRFSVNSRLPLIDYAVRMAQFDDSKLLSHLAARRQIQPEHVDLLADEIAGFHQRIAVASSASPWAQVDAAVQASSG